MEYESVLAGTDEAWRCTNDRPVARVAQSDTICSALVVSDYSGKPMVSCE